MERANKKAELLPLLTTTQRINKNKIWEWWKKKFMRYEMLSKWRQELTNEEIKLFILFHLRFCSSKSEKPAQHGYTNVNARIKGRYYLFRLCELVFCEKRTICALHLHLIRIMNDWEKGTNSKEMVIVLYLKIKANKNEEYNYWWKSLLLKLKIISGFVWKLIM